MAQNPKVACFLLVEEEEYQYFLAAVLGVQVLYALNEDLSCSECSPLEFLGDSAANRSQMWRPVNVQDGERPCWPHWGASNDRAVLQRSRTWYRSGVLACLWSFHFAARQPLDESLLRTE